MFLLHVMCVSLSVLCVALSMFDVSIRVPCTTPREQYTSCEIISFAFLTMLSLKSKKRFNSSQEGEKRLCRAGLPELR